MSLNKHIKIDTSIHSDFNRVLDWFIILRWIACAGVLATLLLVYFAFNYQLPYVYLFTLTGILCLVNAVFTVYFMIIKNSKLERKEMIGLFHIQICCDFVLLFFLVYGTGYLENPFIYYFVFHIMLTSFIFNSRIVFTYVASVTVLLIVVLASEYLGWIPHFPLLDVDIAAYRRFAFPRIIGICSTLVISAYFALST